MKLDLLALDFCYKMKGQRHNRSMKWMDVVVRVPQHRLVVDCDIRWTAALGRVSVRQGNVSQTATIVQWQRPPADV
jgi:hypothetical protein